MNTSMIVRMMQASSTQFFLSFQNLKWTDSTVDKRCEVITFVYHRYSLSNFVSPPFFAGLFYPLALKPIHDVGLFYLCRSHGMLNGASHVRFVPYPSGSRSREALRKPFP